MKLRNNRALSSVIGLTMATVLTITGLAVTSPAAQAQDKPTPMSHTIDYVITSPTQDTSYVTTANLESMTRQISDAWNRMSRGVVTGFTIRQVYTVTGLTDDMCRLSGSALPGLVTAALADSPEVYRGQPNGRTLVILADARLIKNCGFGALTIASGGSLASGGMIVMAYGTAGLDNAVVMTHELGHVFGLAHAGRVYQDCLQEYWDGPFSTDPEYFSNANGCPYGLSSTWYGDQNNVMGSSASVAAQDINGAQKYQLGLVQPGAGLIQVTATADVQRLTIHDTHTTNLDTPQTIRLTDNDPDGDGPCTAPVYAIDYDPTLGGVRVFRVATRTDCSIAWTSNLIYPGTIAWSIVTGAPETQGTDIRTYFLPGESRLTQSGKVQISILSADPASGTATVAIQRTDAPGVATVQLTSWRMGSQATAIPTGAQWSGIVTTNQPSWAATSDQRWITVTPSGANRQTIEVSVAPNTSTSERTATVTIRAGTTPSTTTVRVTQQAGDPSLATDCGSTTTTACTWANLATSLTNRLETEGDQDLFRITPATSGTYLFTSAKPHDTPLVAAIAYVFAADGTTVLPSGYTEKSLESASTSVYLSGGQTYYLLVKVHRSPGVGPYTITATTTPTLVTLSPSELFVPAGGGTQTIRITTAGDWWISCSSWCTKNPESGTGAATVTLTFTENLSDTARAGFVRVNAAGQAAGVTITQPAPEDDCGASLTAYCDWPNVSRTLTGTFNYHTDKDRFKFTVPTTGTWAFTASTGEGTSGAILSADGATYLGSGSAANGRNNFSMRAFLTAGETYFLQVATSYSLYPYTVSAALSDTDALSLSTTAITLPQEGGSQTVDVITTGTWSGSATWVQVAPFRGKGNTTVTLSANPNTTGQTRTTDVIFKASGLEAVVTVTQTAETGDPTLTLSTNTWTAPDKGGTQDIQVSTNSAWQVDVPDWISATPASGSGNTTVTLTARANTTGQSRTDNVTFSVTGKQASVKVTQPAQQPVETLSVSPGSVNSAATGDTQDVVITASGSWQVKTPTWVTASPASGTGNSSVTLTTTANGGKQERKGDVTITSGSKTATVAVTQPAAPADSVSLSKDRLDWTGDGGSQTVQVTASGTWQAWALPDWFTVSPKTGQGNATLTITVLPNTTGEKRFNAVYVTCGAAFAAVSILQDPQAPTPVETLSVTPTSVDAVAGGDTHSLDVTASGDWRITGPSWVSLSQGSGTGNASVTVTTTANNTGAPRTGDVTITSGVKTAKVSVTQAGVRDDCGDTAPTSCAWPDLSTPVTGTLEYTGDKDWYKFTAAQSGPYVLSASATATEPVRKTTGTLYDSNGTRVAYDSSGAESYQFRITAELTAGQTYYLQVTGVGTGNYTVTATPPKTDKFTLSTTAFNPGVNGGSLLVQVTAEGDWQVRAPDWIKTKDSAGFGDTLVFLAAEANNTGSPRIGEIVFTSGRQTITVWVHQTNVRQVATTLDVTPSSIATASPKVESIKIQILTDGDWTIEGQWPAEGPPNAYLWPLSGTGDTVVTLNIKPTNPGTHTSSHTNIKVTAGNNTKSIPVDQDPWD